MYMHGSTYFCVSKPKYDKIHFLIRSFNIIFGAFPEQCKFSLGCLFIIIDFDNYIQVKGLSSQRSIIG